MARDKVAGWRDADNVCALSDGERHLGHITRVGRGWKAFDATHLNSSRAGFRELGIFPDVDSAKQAVEASCGEESRAIAAGGLWVS